MTISPHQRGSALVMVLWVALILSLILASSFAAVQIQAKTARADDQLLRAELAAKSGLTLAAQKLSTPQRQATGPILPLEATIGDITVKVDWSPEMRKLDINLADEQTLSTFLVAEGLSQEEADIWAAQIADWRDKDDLVRVNGAEDRDYTNSEDGKELGNRYFYSVQELSSVLDVDVEFLDCIADRLSTKGSASISTSSNDSYPRTAGSKLTIIATASPENKLIAPQAYEGTFRIIGGRQKSFEWISQNQIFPVSENASDKDSCKASSY
jgi:general secretion pathway protein K